MQVNISEAKNRLSQLIKSVRSGQEVVIANRGEPVARLGALWRRRVELNADMHARAGDGAAPVPQSRCQASS
jgi:antitoxin (DNA-binding transcriptional repressor) of toxin-antitoxin stability system